MIGVKSFWRLGFVYELKNRGSYIDSSTARRNVIAIFASWFFNYNSLSFSASFRRVYSVWGSAEQDRVKSFLPSSIRKVNTWFPSCWFERIDPDYDVLITIPLAFWLDNDRRLRSISIHCSSVWWNNCVVVGMTGLLSPAVPSPSNGIFDSPFTQTRGCHLLKNEQFRFTILFLPPSTTIVGPLISTTL